MCVGGGGGGGRIARELFHAGRLGGGGGPSVPRALVLCPCIDMPRHLDAIFTSSLTSVSWINVTPQLTYVKKPGIASFFKIIQITLIKCLNFVCIFSYLSASCGIKF